MIRKVRFVMRKILIDTDTGSDDAVAIIMAVCSGEADIVGITTVFGNVPLNLATQNALMTLEICESDIEVYPGCKRPLYREPVTALNVHGEDGMGDLGLIHPKRKPSDKNGVDYILEMAKAYPDELEIVMLAPATNIATAILKDRETMSRVKHIYSMGTAGFGAGNCTPVSEFNVYADAESYRVLLESKIPLTIIGFDMCIKDAYWDKNDLEKIRTYGNIGAFAVDCNAKLLEYNLRRANLHIVDLPDAVAMAAALWPELVLDKRRCYCYCHTNDDRCYGQVIVYDSQAELVVHSDEEPNADVVAAIDSERYKQKLEEVIRQTAVGQKS